jgi:Uma2 family endonuclease
MSIIVTGVETLPSPEGPVRKRWTRSDCALLEDSGVWQGQRFELIDGDLYDKMGKKRPHVIASTIIRAWLEQKFGWEFIDVEASIDVAPEDNPTNEPEPDLVVLSKPTWELPSNPLPRDILLAVEVSDSTLRFDLNKKSGLYGRAGIGEYWVLDVTARNLVVHRDAVDGEYRSVVRYADREAVRSGVVMENFNVNELFELRPRKTAG